MYKYARAKMWHAYGVEFIHNCCAEYKELITEDDFRKAKNSKYVFCDAKNIYKRISNQLKSGDTTITIDSAISEGWLAKLHAQLSRPEGWLVKELGLITNALN